MLKAKALKKGDVVALIAPASASRSEERINRSVEYLEKQGYRVQVGKHLMDGPGYLAAPDKIRLKEFETMLTDKRVKALFFIRGGYGTLRLLPEIHYDLIKKYPKIIIGYSDATAFFCGIYKKTGLSSMFFGPMPGVDMWNEFDPFSEEIFWRAVTSPTPFGPLPMSEQEGVILRKGSRGNALNTKSPLPQGAVEARMIGGNLMVFSSTFGTPYMPDLKNKILFFEEIEERPYRVDRCLAQLRVSGVFERAAAILLGQFTGCVEPEGTPFSIEEVMNDYFGKLNIPVIANLPWGHVSRQWTVPFGAKMRVEIIKNRAIISVTESVLE